MGRYSRSRQVHQKKQEKATPKGPGREVAEEDSGGGSLMSMRAGFKNIAGVNEKAPQKGGLGSLLGWVLLAVAIVAMVLFLVGR